MLLKRLQIWIDSQYENPRGIVGRYIGEKMVRQHRVEVDWTIEQLTVRRMTASSTSVAAPVTPWHASFGRTTTSM
ncbi:hypothetical protein [Exiguobacterium aurantiacum]|uniref:hypothetical protein n=1 Tax=Exiguobacterium aurantiacum TaxID=33987 RepID=UPI0020B8BB5F|nr:hypothetical protein [Exiguobacterium aurantiacum]